tara:strand:+ start:368 stop:535 length:168 start_codon:yes stop_codon:yes gene_type:complete
MVKVQKVTITRLSAPMESISIGKKQIKTINTIAKVNIFIKARRVAKAAPSISPET